MASALTMSCSSTEHYHIPSLETNTKMSSSSTTATKTTTETPSPTAQALPSDTAAVRTVIGVMGSWAMSVLLNNELRQDMKHKCSERLQLETSGFKVQYAEQAVLANLDWGIEGLESAVKTTNQEARAARLEYSEKMLQVPALLDPKRSTAGIPNTYLSAWAHLNLALLWKLRNNDVYVTTHLLEMLLIDPTYARLDFAPDLWEQLFRPHLANIEIWFQQEYENILRAACMPAKVPNLLKRGVNNKNDSDAGESLREHHYEVHPAGRDLHQEQVVRLELLNKLYMDCLDMNTQQYAQYYKDWMVYAAGGMRSGDEPSLPKTQTPPTPKHQETTTTTTTSPMPLATLIEEEGSDDEAAAAAAGKKRIINSLPPGRNSRTSSSEKEENHPPKRLVHKENQSNPSISLSSVNDTTDSPRSKLVSRESGTEHDSTVGNGIHGPLSSSSSPGEALYAIEVYWNGRRITQGELLQIWDRFSSGQMNSTQANAFVQQFCDRNGQRLTTKKLGELVKYIIQSSQLSLMLQQQQQQQQQQEAGGFSSGSNEFHPDPALDFSSRPLPTTMSSSTSSAKHRDSVKNSKTRTEDEHETAKEQSPLCSEEEAEETAATGGLIVNDGEKITQWQLRQTWEEMDASQQQQEHEYSFSSTIVRSVDGQGSSTLENHKPSSEVPLTAGPEDSVDDDSETATFAITASPPHSPSAFAEANEEDEVMEAAKRSDDVLTRVPRDQPIIAKESDIGGGRSREEPVNPVLASSLEDVDAVSAATGASISQRRTEAVSDNPQDANCPELLTRGVLSSCDSSIEIEDASTTDAMAARQALEQRIQQDASTSSSTLNGSPPINGDSSRGSGGSIGHSSVSGLPPNLYSHHRSSSQILPPPPQQQMAPPKDFVCFITKQLFEDPVTLETGQTFERHAIQEWLDHGNTMCPITHQPLSSRTLPQTNFVLKRLVDAWRDEHSEQQEACNFSGGGGPLCNNSSSATTLIPPPLLHCMNHQEVPPTPFYNNNNNNETSSSSSPRPKHRLSCRFSQRGNLLSQAGNSMTVEDLEGLMRVLKPALASLCTAEELTECEAAIRQIVRIWIEKKGSPAVVASLSKAAVIDGLMEVLSNSVNEEILRATVSLLSVLVFKDELARHVVVRADPSYETVVNVLQMGPRVVVPQAAVLLYLLKPGSRHLAAMDIIPSLVKVLQESETLGMGAFQASWSPKAAAVILLEQLVTSFDSATNMSHAELVVHMGSIPFLISQLESKVFEEQLGAAKVLCCCMQADGGCRYTVAYSANLSPLVEMLHNCKGQSRTVATSFFIELTHLNRREAIEKILRPVQSEGILSSMCVLLVDLQITPLEERPLTAALLLQLDLLFESRRHSMYREEALEALVTALMADENPKAQCEAAKVLAMLGGRFSYSGKSLDEAWLLKTAGMADAYSRAMKDDQGPWSEDMVLNPDEGERLAAEWDFRVSHAILGSNGRRVLKAVGLALRSRDAQVAKLALVAATWFAMQLAELPNTGLQAVARNCFLQAMVVLVQNGTETEQKVLASLALNSFLSDAVGVQQMGEYSKDLIGPLQCLKGVTWTAKTMLNTLVNSPSMNSNRDIWAHGEVHLMDASLSGETRALLFARGFLYSAHMDGSIKVWDTRRREPQLLKEVKAHLKPALCLAYLQSVNQLYTGSADKTIRVWALEDEGMKCLRMVDVKEPVVSLLVNSRFTAILPQGAGIKLLDETGSSKLLNGNKHVQSMLIVDDIIYCGCTDNSIQEIDTTTGAVVLIQAGMRLLRGKKPIYAMQVYQDLLFTAGVFVEGGGTKVWQRLTRVLVTSVPTQSDVRAMAISDDFLYLASNLPGGTIEVWLRARLTKVATLTVGSKVTALSLVGETLYSGSEDGKIRAFALNS